MKGSILLNEIRFPVTDVRLEEGQVLIVADVPAAESAQVLDLSGDARIHGGDGSCIGMGRSDVGRISLASGETLRVTFRLRVTDLSYGGPS